jgi:hypothetical protein
MRLLVGTLGLVLFLGAMPADAGWWPFGRKDDNKQPKLKHFPKAIDYPVVRPKIPHWHKAGKQAGDHPEFWGTR